MSAPLRIDADVALLDFDGLVVDTEYAGWHSWNTLYTRHGLQLAEAEWALQCGRAALFEPWAPLEAIAPPPFDRTALEALRLQLRDEHLRLLPGVREFLATMARGGHRVGLVSNSPEDWILRNLARNDVDPRQFSVIICGDAYAAKPSPERYLAALKALRVTARDAVAVEDSAKGIQAALNAGLRCVAVANRITRHSDLSAAHHQLESLDRLELTRRTVSLPPPPVPGVPVATSRQVEVRVYLVADPRLASLLSEALEMEDARAGAGARVALVDVAHVLGEGLPEEASRLESAVDAALVPVVEHVLALSTSGTRSRLVVHLGPRPAPEAVALLLRRLGPDGLLVAPVSSPLADLVGLDTPALMLSADEATWGAALARLARCHPGEAVVTPTPMEQAMMAASTGARRSSALRGGVGAALVDERGETLMLGTAEVPRYGGGHYWDGEPDDARDFRSGGDPATEVRLQTVEKLLALLVERGGTLMGSARSTAVELLAGFDLSEKAAGVGYGGALARTFESLGRVVHAEMSVLCHAARLGLSVKGLTLCVTAGPCRQCLRHAVCAGLERVVHLGAAILEPPAFLADSVSTRPGKARRLLLVAFEGITPGAYAGFFRNGVPPLVAVSAHHPPLSPHWLGLAQACAAGLSSNP